MRFDVPDSLLAILSFATLMACARYAEQKHNYVVLSLCVPLLQVALYFLLLSFDVEPLKSSIETRQMVIRPALVGLLLGILVFAINGRINSAIDSMLHRVIERWRIFKRSSP